jgi:hypothetical protein
VLDRGKVLSLPSDLSEPGFLPTRLGGGRMNVCVRDVSWHSQVSIEYTFGDIVFEMIYTLIFCRNPSL